MTTTLIVDGYNVAHAWPATRGLLRSGAPLEDTRRELIAHLAAYVAATGARVVAVFDAPRTVTGAEVEVVDGVEVRFGGGAFGSADHLIERLVYEAARTPGDRSVVATGDRLVRDMVRAMGAETVDPAALLAEVREVAAQTGVRMRRLTESGRSHRVEDRIPTEVRRRLEDIRRGRSPGGRPATPPPPPAPPRPPRARDRFRPFDPARDLPPADGGGAPER